MQETKETSPMTADSLTAVNNAITQGVTLSNACTPEELKPTMVDRKGRVLVPNGIVINRFSAKLARRHWKLDVGDVFKYRGQMFKSSGVVIPTFRQWLKKAQREA